MNRIVFLLCLLVPTVAQAQYRGYHRHSYQTYYHGYPQVYYFVGPEIRREAIVQATLAADKEYQEFQNWKKFQAEYRAFQAQQEQQMQAQQQAQQPLAVQQSQTAISCARCHSGNDPGGGLLLDGSPLTAAEVKSIKAKIQSGEMPKPNSPEAKDFDAGAAGQVLSEALDWLMEEPQTLPQRAPQPPPKPTPPPVEDEL